MPSIQLDFGPKRNLQTFTKFTKMLLVHSLKVNNIKKSLRNFFVSVLDLLIFEYTKILSGGSREFRTQRC